MTNYDALPKRNRLLRGTLAGLMLLTACGQDSLKDKSSPNQTDLEFMAEANVAVIAPGHISKVTKLKQSLEEEYRSFKKVDQRSSLDGADLDNSLTYRPYRYGTGFKEGDGSGADTVCEDLDIPDGVKYIMAVTTSDKEAWVAFDSDGQEAHICYDDKSNPDTVLAWGDTKSR